MARCEDIQKRISDYSVGLLNRDQMARVEAHLGECPVCAKELETLGAAMALVESIPQVEPPDGMWNTVYQQITASQPSFADRVRMIFFPPVRALAMGFAVLVLLATFVFGRLQLPGAPVMADAATEEYVQGHVMFAAQDAFADRVGLSSLSAASMTQEEAVAN